jgi:hypothetical protein
MKNNIIGFVIAVLVGMALMFFIRKPQVKEIKVPFRVEVQVPVIEKVFDTIYEPYEVEKEIIVKDEKLIAEYKKANDSLKEALFNSAVTVRDYKEVFEDSTITITVGAKVTGTLNSLIAEYKTKPRIIVLDTTLTVEVPDYSRAIGVYGEIGMPIDFNNEGTINKLPVFKVGFDITNKKSWVYGSSFDTEKRIWFKIGKRFNF